MDLVTIRTRLRRRVGNPQVAEVPDGELNENINDSYRDVATKFRHHKSRKICSFVTTVGVSQYGLPTDVGAVYRVWDDTNNKRLRKRGARWFAELTAQENGKPLDYVRFRNYVELVPPADGIYTIQVYYSHTIVTLAADGDTPELPETWHIGVLHLSEWYYWIDRGDAVKADNAYKVWQLWVRDKPVEVDDETVDIEQGVVVASLSEDQVVRQDFDESL